MSLKTQILSVTRKTKRGLTVGEIFDRLSVKPDMKSSYSTVRARIYEMADSGQLICVAHRKDRETGRAANAFRRSFSSFKH